MPRLSWRALALAVLTTFGVTALPTPSMAVVRAAPPTACASGTTAADLDALFASDIGPVIGADYQRTFPLPDGRTLWVFQDAFLRTSTGVIRLVHNIGLVQSGRCFTLLRSGTAADPRPWLGPARTTPFSHWFWPLGGTVAADGTFRLFVAEMVERGPRYLSNTEPVATLVARIELPTLRVARLRPAADPGVQLYGWSVVDRGRFTYLYGHCYRQFGWSFVGHDACAAAVKVARVPRGRLNRQPAYWDGTTWSTRARRAVNIAPARGPDGEVRSVNPMQIAHIDGCWIAVTKVGDWFGHTIHLDRAPTPRGPWKTAAVLPAPPLGPESEYNTYFASFIARTRTSYIVGLSNNRWDGALSNAYRPTFISIPLSRWGPCGS
jgi:hypothetical protein